MRRPPRDPRAGIFTRPGADPDHAWAASGRCWSTSASSPGRSAPGAALAEAVTLTFVSLVLIQFFKAYAARIGTRVLVRPFANSIARLAAPLSRRCSGPFGTVAGQVGDIARESNEILRKPPQPRDRLFRTLSAERPVVPSRLGPERAPPYGHIRVRRRCSFTARPGPDPDRYGAALGAAPAVDRGREGHPRGRPGAVDHHPRGPQSRALSLPGRAARARVSVLPARALHAQRGHLPLPRDRRGAGGRVLPRSSPSCRAPTG